MDYRTEVREIELEFVAGFYKPGKQRSNSFANGERKLWAAENREYRRLLDNQVIHGGAALLCKGEVVAFPTETVYGLGADAGKKEAVKKIFVAKGRPADNPLIVHISGREQLFDIISGEISQDASRLMNEFWPGPLTLIFPRGKNVPDTVTAGLDTVAVRMPRHPVARALITVSGLPLAAPSANSSGFPSPTRAEHVFADLAGRIPLIIDGGPCPVGVESTVVDLTSERPEILRPGGISREEIAEILGQKLVERQNAERRNLEEEVKTPAAPGMKYRHYSPQTPVWLFGTGDLGAVKQIIADNPDKKITFVLTEETTEKAKKLPEVELEILASRGDPKTAAHRLFFLLRKLDSGESDVIAVEAIPRRGLGEAVMNRLHKAADSDIYLK
ncbi:MAG: L-threonylcarbamoyladenylate synthase [Bacillota bacterium]